MNKLENLTIRQQIIQHLETGPMTERDISQQVRISEKDVPLHLSAIEKSIRHKKKRLHVTSHICLNCGFEFKNRKTYKRPGKCPQCRRPRIGRALFEIISTDP